MNRSPQVASRAQPTIAGPVATTLGLLAMAAAPALVAALRLFPPLEPAAGGASWLPVVASAMAAAGCSAGAIVHLARGVRRGDSRSLLTGAGLIAIAAGLAVAALSAGTGSDGAFPSPVLAVCGVLGGLLLVGGLAAPATFLPAAARLGALLAFFALIDAAVAAGLRLSISGALTPWLYLAAAALAAIAIVPGPPIPGGLLATGLAALAIARPDSVDGVVAVVALGAAGIAFSGKSDRLTERHAGPAESPAAADVGDVAPVEPAVDGEAMRLARELRGTIAELIAARRTIELQRDEITRNASVDALTGAATRRAVLDRLAIELGEARRYRHSLAVALLDVDGFADINRAHGTGVGDEVLREVALRLRLRMRTADALGRVGADSFMALLPHTDETGAATFANALLERLLSRPIDTYDGELRISVSIGLAFMRAGMSLTDEELLAEADAALASARAAGGNRIAFDRMHGLVRLDERRRGPDEDSAQDAASGDLA